MKLLVTSGATREPIDGVRYLTNFSTGNTGARLTEKFAEAGHEVIYLCGRSAARPSVHCETVVFSDFASLDLALRERLGRERMDAVVHLAAVSDYRVERVVTGEGIVIAPSDTGKLDSSSETLEVQLRRNFKILDRIASYAKMGRPIVVGFKLTNTPDVRARTEAIRKVAANPGVDLVVHNDLGDRNSGKTSFSVFRGEERLASCPGPEELAQVLLRLFSEHTAHAAPAPAALGRPS